MINGITEGPLQDWSIVLVAGRTFIGQYKASLHVLEPAYELQCAMQFVQPNPRAQPQLATMRMVQPILTYPSIRSIDVPDGAIMILVSTLSPKERRDLASKVQYCEDMMAAMRAEDAGITVVPAGTRLP